MRLKTLNLELKDVEKFGLTEFYSTKFNSIVALVGKNGSGKTRYLKAIEKNLYDSDITTLEKFDNLPQILIDLNQRYQKGKANFNKTRVFLNAQNDYNNDQKNQVFRDNFSKAANEYNLIANTRDAREYPNLAKIITKEINQRIKVLTANDFRKLKNSFDSGKTQSFQDVIDSTLESIEINEFNVIGNTSLSYLQRLPHKLAFDEIDCRGDEKKFKARVSYQRFKIIQNLISEFLGKDLQWHSRTSEVSEHDDHVNIKTTGFCTINNREFNYEDFSDGEKVLFTYAILIFLLSLNPRIKFKESIIIIDEPELNLHPKAQIKLIDSLEKLVKDSGQIIIATHSLSIVANLDYGSIFLVRDNSLLSPSAAIPFNAIDDLMGFEEHYNKITEFLVSTPAWAMTNFMAECFEDPKVFESANKSDPQLEVFQKLILERNNLTLLDFGSGKGRLIDRLKENESSWSRIARYDCFDIDESFNEIVIAKGANSILNNLNEIQENTYDLIIVVNVLHEIHIKYWQENLTKIKRALKPNGYLAIIEDTELPIGELPNEIGFLIFGKDELKSLLGAKIKFIPPLLEKYKDRIVCGVIEGADINTINNSKIIASLEKLKSNSLKDIIEYRKITNNNVGVGRRYALKANLYVNSQLAIEFLSNN